MLLLRSRDDMKRADFERLTTVASIKEYEIDRWLGDRRDTLLALANISYIELAAQALLTEQKDSAQYQSSSELLQTSLTDFIRRSPEYREVFILSRGGRVLMSTEPNNIGRYLPRDQSSELAGLEDTTFISNVYRSSETALPTVTLTAPILNGQGDRIGTLSSHLNLDRLDEIINDNEGMGKTAENYLVTDLSSAFEVQPMLVSAKRFGADEFPDGIESPGINAALSGDRGRRLIIKNKRVPVIGVYRWLEAQNVALLVELEQAEAFEFANQLAWSILFAGLILAALMTLIIWLLGRRIVDPILNISKTARLSSSRIQKGAFSKLEMVTVSTDNEIGTLAAAFNQMPHHVSESYKSLEEKNQDLELAMRQLKQTQLQMIQSEKMAGLGQMVAGIAHEVNNPVNFIHGNLSHLAEYSTQLLDLISLYGKEYPKETPAIADEKEEMDLDFLKDDFPKILSSMQLGTERIREIVKSMRNFSRLDEADRKVANLHEGIDGTLLILKHRLKAKEHLPAVEVIKEYGDLVPVECFPGQLNQVFLNLLGNAIDAMESAVVAGQIETPTLLIKTFMDADQAVVQIKDNGAGMSESTRKKIFDPFFTTKPVGKGTGLGLAISYAVVVEHHNGMLDCRSNVGEGTEFIIRIPG